MPETLEILLSRWRNGDRVAGDEVMTMLYRELRRLAAHYFRSESPGHTLQPTALVHEVFLKLSSGGQVPWRDRTHLFAVAARQMRRVLIDHARRRLALKRGETRIVLSLSDQEGIPAPAADLESMIVVD